MTIKKRPGCFATLTGKVEVQVMGAYSGYNLPRNIVMISTADWDAPIWTNKQQIASRLVGDFRILYIEPLASLADGKRGYVHRYWRDSCGVHVLRPPGTVPFGQKLPRVNDINHRLVMPIVRDRLEQLSFEDFILWIYPPSGSPYITHLAPTLSCYDCVDEYSAMPGAWMQVTRRMERELVRSVDLVFTTARSLYEDKAKHNINTHFVPNVADYEHFHRSNTVSPSPELEKLDRPVIGYVGSLNYKLDDRLMDEIFSLRPGWSFVLVGPDRGFGVERFMSHPNVHILGRRPTEELPELMAAMDVCIIPYKVDRYTRGVLPLKFFEYMASGRPVVTTRLPELEPYEDLIDLCGDAAEFVQAIEERLAKDNKEALEKRSAVARANSWEKRITTILHKLEDAWRGKKD